MISIISNRLVRIFNSGFINFYYNSNSADFVPLAADAYQRQEGDAKLIAYYLPQFHAIPLNDKNFGRGFTEWDNVTKAKPQYVGHHQPQLPIDVGFYDLSHDDVMYRQIELARQYGIYGFCFHYYWFGKDKRLLEKPIFNWLKNKKLDFPFCLCWANENWSTQWDGGERNVIMEQKMEEDTYREFLEDILPFLEDKRYICVDGRPMLTIYRPTLFTQNQFVRFVDGLQEEAKKAGFEKGLFLIATNACQKRGKNIRADEWHVDALSEFPPHGMGHCRKIKYRFLNPFTNMLRFDVGHYVRKGIHKFDYEQKVFKGVFPSWDNTARKVQSKGWIFDRVTPDLYRKWLSDSIAYTQKHMPAEEQFVFINAWNEWAEGAHLEPDKKYGYAYLAATRKALEQNRH